MAVEQIRKGKSGQTITPIVDTMPADLLTPLAVFLVLSDSSSNCFLLESVEGGETVARYSFIGADPYAAVMAANDHVLFSRFDDGSTTRSNVTAIEFLRRHFADSYTEPSGDLPAFIGGAIGYLGFDCVDWFEPTLKTENSLQSRAEFMIFHSIVAFDHAKQVIKIISLVFSKVGETNQSDIDAARRNNRKIRNRIENAGLRHSSSPTATVAGQTVSNFERTVFEKAVSACKEYIFAGDCYQVVLSQRFSRETAASDISVYRALRSTNPSPYMFLLRFKDRSIVGASPEMLVRCTGDRLDYRPIAGTRPRGGSANEDAALADEMRNDEKEVAEHLMLVDLGRNDLGRVAEYGSVKVDELMKVEKYSHVQHLVSSLSAKLRSGLDRFDALASCFPAGTVSGAPKVRSIEIIRELEPDERGVYAGAVGYFDYSGNMDTCIAIRTLVLENGIAKIQAGAGIVADSVPEREYEETVNKAKALLRAVEIAELGEL
jgi:anthranilate synthase component 1